jgi:DNA-binding CsgD family transcriptional regulator
LSTRNPIACLHRTSPLLAGFFKGVLVSVSASGRKRKRSLDETVNDTVASLYDGVFQMPFAQFQSFALDSLMNLIGADAALWATGVQATQSILSMTLRNIAPAELMEYQQSYFARDYVVNIAIANPGMPIRREDFGSNADHAAMPEPIDFGWADRIHHSMTTTSSSIETDIAEAVSVFREDADQAFSDAERDINRLIFPHMIAAWRHRQLLHMYEASAQLTRPHTFSERGHAVINNDGVILTADALFLAKLRDVFCDWKGPLLPPPIAHLLGSGKDSAVTDGLDLQFTRGEIGHVVSVTSAVGANMLSRSEKRVAALFAKGHSHTEIAATIGVSQSTVRNQISAVYRKLDIHSKMELMRLVT